MWLVWDSLFLGDKRDASEFGLLKRHGITHIVNCTREVPCYFPFDFEYLTLGLADPDPEFIELIEHTCQFIDMGRQEGNVFVHCVAAVSRSPSVIIAYLCHLGYKLDVAYALLDQVVSIGPDPIFIRQLSQFFNEGS